MYFCIKFLISKTKKYLASPVQQDSHDYYLTHQSQLKMSFSVKISKKKKKLSGRPCITPLPLAPQELSCQNKTKSIDYNRHRISDWINPLTKPSPISFQFFFCTQKTLTSQSRDNFRPFPTKSCISLYFPSFAENQLLLLLTTFFRFYKKRKNAKA